MDNNAPQFALALGSDWPGRGVTMTDMDGPVAPSGESPDGTYASERLAGLLRRSATGDQRAFADLYDAVLPGVHGLVARMIRDRRQAEEVTQEAFLQIWRTASRFDQHRGTALSWVLMIAHRKAVDWVRSAEVARRHERDANSSVHDIPYDVTADSAHASLEAQRVRAALSSLTPTQRGALELAFLGGYSHSEVAEILGLPIGTAKTRIRDGLIRLRQTLGIEP